MNGSWGNTHQRPATPLIADAFFRAGYIESWGRGIEKINRECRQHGIEPPLYDTGMSGLMLTFQANPEHLIAALGEDRAKPVLEGKVGERVGETRVEMPEVTVETPVETVETPEVTVETPVETPDRIIELLRAHPHLTLGEVAAQIGKSVSAVERASVKLTREGRLRRVGPRKGGHWEVLK